MTHNDSTESNENDGDRANRLARYRDALDKTNGLIDLASELIKSPELIRARSEERMARLRKLLGALGDPHLRYRVVHVGGTSGKGSTSVMTASLLRANGLRTGLHTSPYLQVATEKIQIDGRLLDSETFHRSVGQVIGTANASGIGHINYGEAWFAIVALVFAWAKVDVAVIEVGAGGRFDLTNVVEPEVSIITSVGYDHMESLGSTIAEIAWHKAGIIKHGAPVVCAVIDNKALAVIRDEAERQVSEFLPVVANVTFGARRTEHGTYDWWEKDAPESVYASAMPGRYQATNAATALTAVRRLIAPQSIAEESIRKALASARLPGRWEVVSQGPEVILDGAHNPEKSAALARDLRTRRTERTGSRIIVVLGVLESKDRMGVLKELVNVADELVTTSPSVLAKPGSSAAALAADARSLGFIGPISQFDNSREAIDFAVAHASPEDLVVVTGSLYLIGNVRGRWFPDDEIVLQQTSWPAKQPLSSSSPGKHADSTAKDEIPE